jgi:hypothetical protein
MGFIGSMIVSLAERRISRKNVRDRDACTFSSTGTLIALRQSMARIVSWSSLLVVVCLATVATTADAQPKRKKAPAEAPKTEAPAAAASEFDKQAAVTAITEVSLQKCRATNAEKGEGHVTITFGPGGTAQNAQVDKGPWIGTPVAKCMAKEFKKAKVPAFKGDAVTVGKTFHFE